MASAPIALPKPPAPPDVSAQTGGGAPPPAAALAGMVPPQQPEPPPGGGANPAAAFLALGQTLARFLKQGAQMSDVFAPYADRALAVIEAGISDVTKSMPGAAQQPGDNSAPTGSSGTAPGQVSAAPTTGPGAPGFPG